MSNHTQNMPVNASNGSSLPALSDSFENLGVLTKVRGKKPKKAPPRHPESWGKLSTIGAATCLCAACGEIFKSVGGFDAHREHREGELDRRCLSPDEMRRKKMSINNWGLWIRTEFVPFTAKQTQEAVTA